VVMLCLLRFVAIVFGLFGHFYPVQEPSEACKNVAYENRNQTDYGPLRIVVVRGIVRDGQRVGIPNACVGVFTESDHKLVVALETDGSGHFEVAGVPKGDYRLVVKYPGFCPANARVRVQAGTQRAKPLAVHMRPAGIDICSYVDRK